MRMTVKAMIAAGAMMVGAYAQTSDAARFFLSLDATGAGGPSVPVVDTGFNGTVYIMAALEAEDAIPAMGISLHADDASNFVVSNATLLNPTMDLTADDRWNQTSTTEGSGNMLIGELFGVQVGGGLATRRFTLAGGTLLNDPTFSMETGFVQVATFDLEVIGDTGALWLSAGPNGIPVQPNAQNQGDLIGFGDDDAPNNLVGPSGNPDLVVPEPASMALVGLGALAMLRRRQA